MLSSNKLGYKAERIVKRHISIMGFSFLLSNFSIHNIGEIDIIALEREHLVFIEVRSLTKNSFYTPAETISNKKKNKVLKTASYFLSNIQYQGLFRFDIAEVIFNKKQKVDSISYSRDVFNINF